MFARLRNTPVDYAWGTDGEITRLLGDAGACTPRADGGPEAELWLGAHHGSPSHLADPAACGGASDLAALIAADPVAMLGRYAQGLRAGDGARLPFLVKVLAAGSPLSLQAHPSLRHAREGFAREEALGLPIDAPVRNYRDASHKPELLLALSDTMEALAGVRPHAHVLEAVDALAAAGGPALAGSFAPLVERVRAAGDEAGRRDLVAWLLARSGEALAATDAVAEAARRMTHGASGAVERDRDTVRELAGRYPGDPGVVIALLLNRVTLRRGEAIFVGAGALHAYLRGVGLEVMAASDNVLRGGLTPKHIDVPELLRVFDAAEAPEPRVEPVAAPGGICEFPVPVPDFRLVRVRRRADAGAPASIATAGPAIALCLGGAPRLTGGRGEVTLAAGEAVFVSADEGALEVVGAGDVLVATVGLDADAPLPVRD